MVDSCRCAAAATGHLFDRDVPDLVAADDHLVPAQQSDGSIETARRGTEEMRGQVDIPESDVLVLHGSPSCGTRRGEGPSGPTCSRPPAMVTAYGDKSQCCDFQRGLCQNRVEEVLSCANSGEDAALAGACIGQ
jgi:hypothetical protein